MVRPADLHSRRTIDGPEHDDDERKPLEDMPLPAYHSGMDIGTLISEARHRAGLTQARLAARSGTSQAAIARYENNTVSPAVATLERVMRAAGAALHVSSEPAAPSDLTSDQAIRLRHHRRDVIKLARRAGATNLRLFGSVSRGEARLDSDIDLLVDFDSSAGLLPILRLREELSDLLGYDVDIAPSDMLRDDVAVSVLAEAVAL